MRDAGLAARRAERCCATRRMKVYVRRLGGEPRRSFSRGGSRDRYCPLNAVTQTLGAVREVPREPLGPELRSRIIRGLLGVLPEYMFVLDRDLRVLVASRAFESRAPEQLEGRSVVEVLPQHLHEVALTTLQQVATTGQSASFAAQLEGEDAQVRHFDVRIAPLCPDAQTVWFTLIATEITEQVRAERAIATQARMIESMLEGVAVITAQGTIEITNPSFDAMFGYGRGELIGRDIASLAGWPFQAPERWQRTGESAPPTQRVEFDGRRADGSVFAAAGVLSAFDVAGRDHSLLVVQDVSERKRLERAVLEAVNREHYRIGNDLHDGLGQELTGIALMLRGLAGRAAAEHVSLLPEIDAITRLVSNAIESTRALARGLSPVNLERGGLKDALDGLAMHAVDLYGVQAICTHRLEGQRELNPELANHLYRIAQEAVRNAVRHGQARTIRLHLHCTGAKVRLTVTDDGVGMRSQAHDAPGMGLKIMQYRARILGGEVRFERNDPSGTRIVCECPIAKSADESARVRVQRKPRRVSRPT